MLSLLADLDPRSYNHRTYVISEGDDFSAINAISFEDGLTTRATKGNTNSLPSSQTNQGHQEVLSSSYTLRVVPRARKIHQSLFTTPFSSFHCLLSSLILLYSLPTYPDLILLNGPATSTIVLLSALMVRFFDWRGRTRGKLRSIYVESWARVKSLSLSARIITTLGAADRVLVQWEYLAGKGEYRGCLIR
jgi:beta-1,4-N-acetylglucosaminyltransferase